ncbi:dentin sialophosphoprotein isoform X2 [Cucurbita moschata]|uniref:Dentin sialophosphoprotein isoform X2 n=1 Tax=Cucurbita moschata TaxID=3662 RepID=A0A6J1GAJ0_CUCMO|nr:dentin sialophosphoprotein isoform X2 [Cucurbita moschata]
MYGGPSKLARAGGGAGRGASGKRPPSSFPLPPAHRPSGRLSLGGGGAGSGANPRNRTSTAAKSEAPLSVEENFSLVTGNNPLAFAMIIRLAPDLIEEIKRVESLGGTPRIKFDANAKNSSGNVIDVGGKEFRFTWSREVGDLCDIYEERKSGEDGSGLLVESGNAWRKVNVQRILDESTTNHVKKLSEEAERRSKSRRAIVLEPGNPSMKNQIKQLAAAESNPWRMHYKNKKEPPFKKQKNELSQVGPPKSTFKPGMSSVPASKERLSSSPVPSPPEQSGAPISQFGSANPTKTHCIAEDIKPRQPAKINAAASSEKEIPTKAAKGVLEAPGQEVNAGAKPTDLQGMLYNLLLDNPKGMSLKALEKAVGDKIPNSVKKIEPIIKKIATYQAPGRYCLKSEVELEGSKKPSSEGESSPLVSHQQTPVHEDFHDQPVPESQLEARHVIELEEKVETSQANKESNFLEKNGIQQNSPDPFAEKKGSENSEGQAASSSDNESDSDSESDSSDSGSDSGNRSRSRSRSPVGSGSGSSSDSESDAPSNSKEGSDEDVDIMTSDDDKEPKNKLQASVQGFSASPAAWKSPDGGAVLNIDDEKEDGHESDAIDIEKDSSDDEPEAKIDDRSLPPTGEGGRPVEESRSLSPYPDEFQERQNFIGSLFEDRENTVVESSRHEQSDSTDRISKGKSKRSSELECFEENAVHTKRLKLESSSQQPVSGNWGAQLQSSRNLSPSKLNRDSARNPTSQVTNKGELKGNSDFRPKMGNKEIVSEKNCSDVSQASWRPHDQSGVRAVDTAVRPDKHGESIGRGGKHSEKGGHANESFHAYKDRFYGNVENEGMNEKKVSRNSRSGGPGDKQIQPCDSHLSKPGDIVGKFKDGKTFSSSQMGYSPRDNNNRISADRSPVNGKGRILQREHSDLELGELREPFPEEVLGKKKFERNNSSKQLENKGHTSDIWSSELNKGKSNLKASLDNGKRSSPHISTKFPSNPEVSNQKKISEHKVEDLTRVNHRPPQSHPQGPQYSSRVDHVEVEKPVDANVKPNQGIGPESCGESNRKASVGISQLHDMKREQLPSKKGSKRQAPNQITEVTDALKNPISAEHENSDLKRRDSSSDENSCSYSKYEKDEPELKGAIKDFSQYKEYVQEYRDKYECYLSLNKILESYRAEFCKLGKELDSSRGQNSDKYFNLLEQLKESYRLCSTSNLQRHKRLKKIFVVLHEELKHLKERIKDFAQTYAKD